MNRDDLTEDQNDKRKRYKKAWHKGAVQGRREALLRIVLIIASAIVFSVGAVYFLTPFIARLHELHLR